MKCCGSCFQESEAERLANIKSLISYSRAITRNLIKGLKNYNILQNPQYKEAFAITWKFAAENTKVRDVRTMKTKAQVGAGEDDEAKIDVSNNYYYYYFITIHLLLCLLCFRHLNVKSLLQGVSQLPTLKTTEDSWLHFINLLLIPKKLS